MIQLPRHRLHHIAPLLLLLSLASCAGTATLTPLNPDAQQIGTPRFEYTKTGLSHGSVIVTMPDGERLTGPFQVIQQGAIISGFNSRGVSSTAFATSGGAIFWSPRPALGPL